MSHTSAPAALAIEASKMPRTRLWRAASVVYVVTLTVAAIYVILNAPAMWAAMESYDAAQIDQENTVFCQNFNMARGTDSFANCADHLAEVRKRHAERLARDLIF